MRWQSAEGLSGGGGSPVHPPQLWGLMPTWCRGSLVLPDAIRPPWWLLAAVSRRHLSPPPGPRGQGSLCTPRAHRTGRPSGQDR